jgi:hypothetical protein
MCSSKFTVKDGICCDQTSLERHWIEFKERELEKINQLKPLYARLELTYMAVEAKKWLAPSTLIPPYVGPLEKFFKFDIDYPNPFAGGVKINDMLTSAPLYPPLGGTRQAHVSTFGTNLIAAIPGADRDKIRGIFELLDKFYETTDETGINLKNLNIVLNEERSNFNVSFSFLLTFYRQDFRQLFQQDDEC